MNTTQHPAPLALPQTPDALRECVRQAITHYMGSPVKKENKLNEALAIGLGFDNHDQLSPLLNAYNEEVMRKQNAPYPLDLDYYKGEQTIIVNGYRIPTALVHDEIIKYTVALRSDRIDDLRRRADIPLTQAEQTDLEILLASNEKYVLEAYGTNGFVAGDDDATYFNQVCDEMIDAAKEHFLPLTFAESATDELSVTAELAANAYNLYTTNFGIYPTSEELFDNPEVWNSVPADKRDMLSGCRAVIFGLRNHATRLMERNVKSVDHMFDVVNRLFELTLLVSDDKRELIAFVMNGLTSWAKDKKERKGVMQATAKVIMQDKYKNNEEFKQSMSAHWELSRKLPEREYCRHTPNQTYT